MNTQGFIRCPLCGEVCQGESRFLAHLAEYHCGGEYWINCWCWRKGLANLNALSRHLSDSGGVEAHFHDHLMGILEEQP